MEGSTVYNLRNANNIWHTFTHCPESSCTIDPFYFSSQGNSYISRLTFSLNRFMIVLLNVYLYITM